MLENIGRERAERENLTMKRVGTVRFTNASAAYGEHFWSSAIWVGQQPFSHKLFSSVLQIPNIRPQINAYFILSFRKNKIKLIIAKIKSRKRELICVQKTHAVFSQ